jgi:hypothetical protein
MTLNAYLSKLCVLGTSGTNIHIQLFLVDRVLYRFLACQFSELLQSGYSNVVLDECEVFAGGTENEECMVDLAQIG